MNNECENIGSDNTPTQDEMIDTGSMTITPNLDNLLSSHPDGIIDRCVSGDDYSIDPNGDGIRIDTHNGIPNCFAFSFIESQFYIKIDLVKKGIDSYLLDCLRPKIRISQKVSNRRDCSSKLRFSAELSNEKCPLWNRNERIQKEKSKEWDQWTDEKWEEMIIEFDEYPRGIRHLTILNQGCDTKYWKGFYGPRIVDFKIEILIPEIEQCLE